jgi:aquaglyceroporin related protein
MATKLPQIEGDPDEWKSSVHDAPTAQDNAEPADPKLKKTSSYHQSIRRGLGLHPSAPIAEEHDLAPHQDYLWSRIRLVLREPFAEFLGVFILVLFGDGSVAQVLMSAGETSAPGTSKPQASNFSSSFV